MIDQFLVIQVIILILGLRLYMYLASKYGIYDIPNERSSHQLNVIRGGGIIFWLAVLLAQIFAGFSLPYFVAGITLIAIVSFTDDLRTVSPQFRFVFQLLATALLFLELDLISTLGWWCVPLGIFGMTLLNAYNFMDGINGITGIYSLVFLTSLLFIPELLLPTQSGLIYVVLASLVIFGYYNFRKSARVFAGDVGSMSLGYLVLYFILVVILETNEISFILFLAIYGIDSFWTVLFRISRKENIFSAHRTHLYQYLSNEFGWQHLTVSLLYGLVQVLVNFTVVINYFYQMADGKILTLAVLIVLSIVYLILRLSIIKAHQASEL